MPRGWKDPAGNNWYSSDYNYKPDPKQLNEKVDKKFSAAAAAVNSIKEEMKKAPATPETVTQMKELEKQIDTSQKKYRTLQFASSRNQADARQASDQSFAELDKQYRKTLETAMPEKKAYEKITSTSIDDRKYQIAQLKQAVQRTVVGNDVIAFNEEIQALEKQTKTAEAMLKGVQEAKEDEKRKDAWKASQPEIKKQFQNFDLKYMSVMTNLKNAHGTQGEPVPAEKR